MTKEDKRMVIFIILFAVVMGILSGIAHSFI